jgi:PhzF family phenazine biosynthesis protein
MMELPIYQVDAFTAMPFAGNPAAVCLLSEPRDAQWMQHVAAEMNLAETAFLHPRNDGFNLRWFTPAVEVDLCGHATLASAHVLWETGRLEPEAAARFHTRSGLLTARQQGAWIEMDFPAEPEEPATAPDALVEALGIAPKYVGRNRFDYLVEVDSEETVQSLRPDFKLLATVPTRGVIVTSLAASPEHDFVSRFFAPRAGIEEDPVTGSAHCCLGPFWGQRAVSEAKGGLRRETLVGYQASARGGTVRVRLKGDRVDLGGQAVTVLRGCLVEGAACGSRS